MGCQQYRDVYGKPDEFQKIHECCPGRISGEADYCSKGRDIFNQAGIPTFDTPERAVRAFMDIYRFSKNIEMLQQIPSRLPKRLEFDRETAKSLIQEGIGTENCLLTEMESKALFSSYGIPVNRMEQAVIQKKKLFKRHITLVFRL